jgi:hypothetical protein
MTNAEILKRLNKAHHWIQHGAVNKTGESLDIILDGITEAYQVIDKLNTLDRLEKKVRQLEKQLSLQK